jgi:type I restriction enzyme S subunit
MRATPGQWEETSFRDVFGEKQERNTKSCIRTPITVGKYAITKQSDQYHKSIASADVSSYWIIECGDFVYDPMSAYYGAIGRYDLVDPGIVSPAYRVLSLRNGFESDMIKHVIKSHYVRFQLEAYSSQNNQAGKRRLLHREAFGEVSFPCPEIDEQRRIAELLTAGSREVSLLSGLLDAIQRQKRGLMQQLLTEGRSARNAPRDLTG